MRYFKMDVVQEFYNKSPFPDYSLNRFNSIDDLKLAASKFARLLDESIPRESTIIDVGTGTGQLASFLSLRRKCVYGVDFSDSSLKKAHALKQKLKLSSLILKKVDITDQKQIDNINRKFDYVLCFGVLHHIPDSYKAFQNIVGLMNPKGHIAIGLYNKFGRVQLRIRKLLAHTLYKNNQEYKDRILSLQLPDTNDRETLKGFWNDQYKHPHETTYTIGEVLRWFRLNNIEYMHILHSKMPKYFETSGLWNDANEKYPYFPLRAYKQLKWVFDSSYEGGYWITFGKKADKTNQYI